MANGNTLNYREVLVKKPFFEITPQGYMKHNMDAKRDDNHNVVMPEDHLWGNVKTQADFLREYFPSAHRIFNESEYPNIFKKDPDTGKWYEQPICRTAFAFQQVIATKHILHLTGNDVQFEIADGAVSKQKEEEYQKNLIKFRKGWLMANMEIRHYEAIRSLMIVAEAAVVGYIDEKGKFGAKTMSYMTGDTLYPHYDSITGELKLFARKYYDYNDNGIECTEWVEVWDDEYIYRYRKGLGDGKAMSFLKQVFGLGGYELVGEPKKHGFPFIPVAYIRNDEGACWSVVQKNIEDFEEAFSYLCENNKAYAFPIFYTKGDGEDITISGDMNGSAKYVGMTDTNADAGFLNGTDASNAFATQLNKSYDLIYELSFTVKPPELKSGDLPAAALKLLFSPAIEIAENDSKKYQPFLNKLVEITKFGVGYEEDMTATMMALPINSWIEVYVHQNVAELTTNLATAVQNKFLSRRTASERLSVYAKNDEFARIMSEEKEKQSMDLLNQIALSDAQTQNQIEEQEAEARINRGKGGQDVNNAPSGKKRGRPARKGIEWDENGNYPGRNNWNSYKSQTV